jgi:hypothetical protein
MRTRLLAACLHQEDRATCCVNLDSNVFVHGGLFLVVLGCFKGSLSTNEEDSTASLEHPLDATIYVAWRNRAATQPSSRRDQLLPRETPQTADGRYSRWL